MSDINANIGVNFDTAQALAELKNLQRQLSQFHTSISKTSESAAIAQRNLQTNLLNSINATGNFVAQMGVIKTSTESFTHALETNKLSMREYFRYAGGASKTFGKLFSNEFNTISKVAEERVKRLQTQYIKMGRDTTGAMRAMAVMPATLDMSNLGTKTQIAAQKQAIFNQLLKQGSTQLLNFGKNTQWAGRQLMVGFTVPLMAFGSSAVKAFTDVETAVIKFRKVYGDLGTTQQQTDAALGQIKDLANAYTQYGVAVKDTIGLAADAAAAGYQNQDLIAQTTAATKLSVLGQIDNQQALKTTISLQSAFNISAKDLAGTIDFLNAVENQTVVSLDDITTAIPIASPVIKQLGGSVKDLAFFLTAMKEGGVSAAQGANALKSGLASLINPSKKASDLLATVGININDIVTRNKGDLKATVMDFAKALDTLNPLSRARAIEVLFGKFQFARMSTLFQNISKDGSQAARVMDLMGMSASDLASITNKELGVQGASALTKFRGSIERLKSTLAPVGELFMKIFTPVIKTIGDILDKFNHLSDGVKKTIGVIVAVIGGIGPIALMTFGLLSNAFANAVKLFATLRAGYQRLTGGSKDLGEQTQYLTTEQLDAAAAAHSLDQSHAKLIQTFTAEAGAVNQLRQAYSNAVAAGAAFTMNNPGMIMSKKKFAGGGIISGPGTGTSDSIPAMVSNGESIIPAKQTKKYGRLINAIINNQVPGFMSGKSVAFTHAAMPFGVGSAQYAQGIKIAGLEELAQTFPQFIKVVSNLVAELPQALNIAMKKGADVNLFAKEYGARTGKFAAAAKLGGLDIANPQATSALQSLEDEIGQATIDLAKQRAAGGKVVVSDEIFAEATKKTIAKYTEMDTAIGNAARALDAASQQIGQIRVSAGKADIVKGLESGQFVRSKTGSQTQNQILFNGVNVGRESATSPGTFYSGNPISPAGSYKGKKKQALLVEAQQDAQAYEAAIQKNTEDIYVKTRQRKSPHPLAGQDGADDAQAYENAVVRQSRRSRRATSPGGTVGPGGIIIANTNINNETNNQVKKTGITLDGLNRAIMGTTFALTTLGSIGSMTGGALGGLSTQVAKYSGILFGLMSITQLLTQTSIVKLAQDRLAIGSNAMRAVNIASFAKTGSGVTGFLPKLAQLGFGISKFLGPIGIATTVFAGLVGIVKLVNAAKEKERQAIEGLGKAANISAAQIAKLGTAFGVTPFKGSIESLKTYVPANKQQRTLIQQARDALAGDKSYQQDVSALKGASSSQAKILLQGRASKLLGAGFAKDQVQAIIQAMEEDAGKTKLNFKVESIDVTTKGGQAGLQKSAQTLIDEYQKAFAKGYSKTTTKYDMYGQKGTSTTEILSKDLKKKLSTASQDYAAFFVGLQSQFQSGQIGAKDLSQSFDSLTGAMAGLTSDQASKLFPELLSAMNKDLPNTVGNISGLSNQFLILKGAIAGLDAKQLGELAGAIRILSDPTKYSANDIAAATKTVNTAKTTIQSNLTQQDKASQSNGTGNLDLGSGTKTPYQNAIQGLKDQTAAISNQMKAYNLLRKAKYDVKTASDLAADSTVAEALAQAKNATQMKAVLALIKQYNAEKIKQAGTGVRTEIGNIQQQLTAYKKLIDAGIDAAGAADLVQNADYSQYLNSLKVGSTQWKNAVTDAKQLLSLKDQLANPGMGAPAIAIQKQIDGMLQKFQDQKAAADTMFAIREQAITDKYASRLGSPGVKGSDQIAVEAAQKEVDAVQKLITAKQNEIRIAQHAIDLKQHDMDMNSQLIDQYNQQIDALQHQSDIQYGKPLQALQNESDILSNNLTLIDKQAQAINDQYDKQVAALELVNKANQDAINMGKQRISIADALTSGDISAAAQAVQDLRAQQADAQGQAQQNALDAARRNSLDNLTAGGMTKAQIEERQFQIQQQSFALQQQQKAVEEQIAAIREQKIYPLEQANLKIQNEIVAAKNALYPLEQQLYDLENNQLATAQAKLDKANEQLKKDEELKQAELDALTAEKAEWDKLQLKIDAARLKQQGLNGDISSAIALVNQLAAAYAALAAAQGASTTTATTTTAMSSSGVVNTAAGQSIVSAAQAAAQAAGVNSNAADSIAHQAISSLTTLNGGQLLSGAQVVQARKSILGYLANGGLAKGTDTVPAMLTPGEFVVNAAASKAYRPMLKAMNSGTYPNMERMFGNGAGSRMSSSLSNIVTDNSQVAYNYNLSVNMNGQNVDAHDVAYAVLTKIRQLENGRVKGQAKY